MTTDKILAIDVGTVDSGYAIMRFDKDDIKLLSFGKIANEALMQIIKNNGYDQLVYEQFQSFGMAIGESTIESILWNGRLIQAAIDRGIPVDRIYRKEEKLCLCNTLRAKDANIRQALIDRYAKTDKKNGKGARRVLRCEERCLVGDCGRGDMEREDGRGEKRERKWRKRRKKISKN